MFAEAALVARYAEAPNPVTPEQVLRPRRQADVDGDLWTVFNRVQENIIWGGLRGTRQNEDGRIIRCQTRPINGSDQNVSVNRALLTQACPNSSTRMTIAASLPCLPRCAPDRSARIAPV